MNAYFLLDCAAIFLIYKLCCELYFHFKTQIVNLIPLLANCATLVRQFWLRYGNNVCTFFPFSSPSAWEPCHFLKALAIISNQWHSQSILMKHLTPTSVKKKKSLSPQIGSRAGKLTLTPSSTASDGNKAKALFELCNLCVFKYGGGEKWSTEII